MSRKSTLHRIAITAIATFTLAGSAAPSALADDRTSPSGPAPGATISAVDQDPTSIKKIPANLKFNDLTLKP